MDKKGNIRRSRRLREKQRDRRNEGRKSVGDDLGVTPVRGKAVNLAEARAIQDARAAAREEHEMSVTTRGRRRQRETMGAREEHEHPRDTREV